MKYVHVKTGLYSAHFHLDYGKARHDTSPRILFASNVLASQRHPDLILNLKSLLVSTKLFS